jgi:DNA-binding winged helix-turn-helix (wHTH) protein/tetratricopeptide (TPR) repeat protein
MGHASEIYEFGPFRLEVKERRLLRDGRPVQLRAKVFDTLRVLVENHGKLVGKDDMMKAVWPSAVVEEGNLAHNLTVLRKTLGDRETGGRHIETVPGQGYRFIASVRVVVEDVGENTVLRQSEPQQPIQSWEQRLESARAALAAKLNVVPVKERFSGHVVGRTRALAEMFSGWETACSGQGLVLSIAGEPGIGKSTLFEQFLTELRKRAVRSAVAIGRCSERLAESEAYLPVLEALGTLISGDCGREFGELMKLVAPTWYVQVAPLWASADPSFSGVVSEAKAASRERMKRELAGFLQEVARIQPLVLFLDDLHWADASTTELLAYLSQRLAAFPILAVMAYRPSEMILAQHPFIHVKQELQKQSLCREVDIGLLSGEDVATYLDLECSGRSLPPGFAELIFRRTEGNPLFMADLVRHLRDSETLDGPLEVIERKLPESVKSMIQRRIDRLNPDELELLSAAAVQGQEFDSRILGDVLQLDSAVVENRLRRLDREHFFLRLLYEKELPDLSLSLSYAFAHVLYQHAIYEMLTPSRRLALSRATAEAVLLRYETSISTRAAQLALLFELARDFDRAAEFFASAAAHAAGLFANDEALRLSSRAIANAEKLQGRARQIHLLAAFQQIGQLRLVLSQFPEAVEAFEQAEKTAEEIGDVDAQVNAICAAGMAQFTQRRMEIACEYASRALKIAQAAGSELGGASAELVLGLERMCFGATAEAEAYFARSVPVLRKHGPPLHALEGVGYAGLSHAWKLDYEAADHDVNWTLQKARDLGLSYHIVMNLFVRGMTLFNQGLLSQGMRDLQEGLKLAEKNRERFWLSRYPNTLGWVHRELQDFETALRLDMEGAQIARENGYGKPEANSHVNLAHNYIGLGESHRALEHLRRAEEIFEADIWFRWRYNIRLKAEWARYWLARGDTAQAHRDASESIALGEPRKARKHVAWGHKLLGDVAAAEERFADARREYQTALRALEGRRCPVIEWNILLAAADMASAHGDVSFAECCLGRCRQVVGSMADSLADESLRWKFLRSEAISRVLS